MEGRGERVALVKGLLDAAPGFVQAGVIEGHAHQRPHLYKGSACCQMVSKRACGFHSQRECRW